MRARTTLYSLALTCGLGALVAGCRDVAAPNQSAVSDHVSVSAMNTGITGAGTYTYNPSSPATFYLPDMHRIEFPAGAVCDPLLSTYGVTEWDQPCTPLTTPIAISVVTSRDAAGHPRVDFTPSLRFVPGKEVVLYLRDRAASTDSTAVIQWCGPDGQCVEEPAFQPAYQTKRDASKWMVYRSIKHFSGYLISAGWDRAAL